MNPSQRRRVVFGFTLLLVGIAVGTLGPVIAGLLLMPKDASDMMRYMTEVHQVGSVMNALILGGMAVAALGLLLAFVEWARWFVMPGPKIEN